MLNRNQTLAKQQEKSLFAGTSAKAVTDTSTLLQAYSGLSQHEKVTLINNHTI